MGLGMGRVERAAESMAQAMVQPGRACPQRGSGQAGAVQGPGARVHVAGFGNDERQILRQGADALQRHYSTEGIGVFRGRIGNGLGHGIHAAGGSECRRERQGQFRVIDAQRRDNDTIAPGGFTVVPGHRPQVGHLRTGVTGGQHDIGQVQVESQGLAKAGGGTAADGNGTVCVKPFYFRCCLVECFAGHVHQGPVEQSRRLVAQQADYLLSGIRLVRRRQHQGAGVAQFRQFFRQAFTGAGGENDVPRKRRIVKIHLLFYSIVPDFTNNFQHLVFMGFDLRRHHQLGAERFKWFVAGERRFVRAAGLKQSA